MVAIIFGVVFLMAFAVLSFCLRKFGTWLAVCTFIYGLLVLGVSYCIIFLEDVWLSTFLIPALFLAVVVGIYFVYGSNSDTDITNKQINYKHDNYIERIEYFFCAGFIGLVMTLAFLSPSMLIDDLDMEQHTFICDYTVTIENDITSVSYSLNDVPEKVEKAVNKKIERMKEIGVTSHSGEILVEYDCNYPINYNHEVNCKCAQNELCELCKKYTMGVRIVEK